MTFDHTVISALVDRKFYTGKFPELYRQAQGDPAPGTNGPVPGIRVVAYDPASHTLQWADAQLRRRTESKLLIAELGNDYQIVTADCPGALLGIPAGTLETTRCRPEEGDKIRLLVPRVHKMQTPRHSPPLQMLDTRPFQAKIDKGYSLKPKLPLNEELGYVLGLVCGDGWAVSCKGSITGVAVAKVREDVMGKFSRCLNTLFAGTPPAGRCNESTSSYGHSLKHTFSSGELGRMVAELCGQGAANKHLPPFFPRAPMDFKLGLFAGLMDSDGSISVSRGKKEPQLMANYTSNSSRMILEVRHLAMGLGIPGRITFSQTPGENDCWVLNFSNKAIQQWGGQHMVNQTKLEKLNSVPEIRNAGALTRHDMVPVSSDLATQICRAIGCPKITPQMREDNAPGLLVKKETLALSTSFRQSADPCSAKYGRISRQSAKKALQLERVRKIRHPDMQRWIQFVENGDITWEQVTKVWKTSVDDIYGFSVPGFGTYVTESGSILCCSC